MRYQKITGNLNMILHSVVHEAKSYNLCIFEISISLFFLDEQLHMSTFQLLLVLADFLFITSNSLYTCPTRVQLCIYRKNLTRA